MPATIKTNKIRIPGLIADLVASGSDQASPVFFVQYDGKKQTIVPRIETGDAIYEPPIASRAVNLMLATGVGKPISPDVLYDRIRDLVNDGLRHPDSEVIHLITSYILASWNYDLYTVVSYLGFSGLPGTGKSEGLKIVWQLSYNAIMASGASSESSIFRSLDRLKSTLCIDEAQKSAGNTTSAYHQILALGNQRHGVVTRSKQDLRTKEWMDESFSVFSPKTFSGRSLSGEEAIQSRTHEVRMPIPAEGDIFIDTAVDESWQSRASDLRNDLLLYRQRRAFGELKAPNLATPELIQRLKLTPRELQVNSWLLREAPTFDALDNLVAAIQKNKERVRAQRGHQVEGQVLFAAYVMLSHREPDELKKLGSQGEVKLRTKSGKVLISGVNALLRLWGFRDIDSRSVSKILRNNLLEVPRSEDGVYLNASPLEVKDACLSLGLEDPEATLASGASCEGVGL